MEPTRITLSGSLGSGKSSVGKALAKHLGAPFISTGEIFRSIGKVTNLSALQTNLEAESNTAIDARVDGFIVEKAKSDEPFIMDSRMAWHFVPRSLKVYLYASYATAAKRIQADTSRETEAYRNVGEAEQAIKKRRLSEHRRYANLYGVDIDCFDNYDLVIVSDGLAIDDLVEIILNRLQKASAEKIFLSKDRLVPMMDIDNALGSFDSHHSRSPHCLDAVLLDGYGFVYERADLLASVLTSQGHIAAINHRPLDPKNRDQQVLGDLKKLDPDHFQRWEQMSHRDFDIKRSLKLV